MYKEVNQASRQYNKPRSDFFWHASSVYVNDPFVS